MTGYSNNRTYAILFHWTVNVFFDVPTLVCGLGFCRIRLRTVLLKSCAKTALPTTTYVTADETIASLQQLKTTTYYRAYCINFFAKLLSNQKPATVRYRAYTVSQCWVLWRHSYLNQGELSWPSGKGVGLRTPASWVRSPHRAWFAFEA